MNLDYITETKFLGIHIVETLKWNSHVQPLASKSSKISFMKKSLKKILSPNMRQNIYFTKFHSLLRFGILSWGGEEIGGELNRRILRIQKEAIRSMVGASSRTSCRQLFKELNIFTLASLYILKVTYFKRKYCQSLKLNSNVHNYNTRRIYKTDIYKRSVTQVPKGEG
jgi:hypothetical protein